MDEDNLEVLRPYLELKSNANAKPKDLPSSTDEALVFHLVHDFYSQLPNTLIPEFKQSGFRFHRLAINWFQPLISNHLQNFVLSETASGHHHYAVVDVCAHLDTLRKDRSPEGVAKLEMLRNLMAFGAKLRTQGPVTLAGYLSKPKIIVSNQMVMIMIDHRENMFTPNDKYDLDNSKCLPENERTLARIGNRFKVDAP